MSFVSGTSLIVTQNIATVQIADIDGLSYNLCTKLGHISLIFFQKLQLDLIKITIKLMRTEGMLLLLVQQVDQSLLMSLLIFKIVLIQHKVSYQFTIIHNYMISTIRT